MTCAEFKELSALYALGALEPTERAACEAHLGQPNHEGCVEALAEGAEAVAALGGDMPEVPPGAHVWPGIERRLGLAARPARRAQRLGAVGWGLAAAAAVLAIFLWWDRRGTEAQLETSRAAQRTLRARVEQADQALVSVGREREACVTRLRAIEQDAKVREEAIALLQLPGTQLFPLAGAQPYAANGIINTGLKRAYVVATGLTPQVAKTYVLWIIRGDAKINVGPVSVDAQGRALAHVDYGAKLPEGQPDALAVSIETSPDVTSPSADIILVGSPKPG